MLASDILRLLESTPTKSSSRIGKTPPTAHRPTGAVPPTPIYNQSHCQATRAALRSKDHNPSNCHTWISGGQQSTNGGTALCRPECLVR